MTDSNKSLRARTPHLGFLALAGFVALAALVAIDLTSSSLPRSTRAQIFGPGEVIGSGNGCADPSGFDLDAWWRFEGNGNDFTGNGHTATQSDAGALFQTGYVVGNDGVSAGRAGNYDQGFNDRWDVADSSAWFFSSNNFTIDAWIYIDDATPDNNTVIVGQSALDIDPEPNEYDSWGFGIAGQAGGDPLAFGVQIDEDVGDLTPDVAALSNAIVWTVGWHFVAVVRSGTTYTFYLDGSAIGSPVDVDPVPDVAAPLQIGGLTAPAPGLSNNPYWGEDFGSGTIDELEISNGNALSAGEISDIYGAGTYGKCTVQITICKDAQIDDGTLYFFDSDMFGVADQDTVDFDLYDGECTDGSEVGGEVDEEGPYISIGGHFEVTEEASSPQTLLGIICTGSGGYALFGSTLEMDLVAGDDLTCTFLNGIRRVGDGTLPNEDLCDTMSDFCPTPTRTPTPTPTSTPVLRATATPTPGSPNIGGIFGGIIGQQPAGIRNQPTSVPPATTAPVTIAPPRTGDGGLR